MSYRPAQKAFTLIEMLVSMAIVATIVTMVYGSYAATSRTLGVYTSRMTCSEQAHLVLRMMARQIRCAYMPPTTTDSTEPRADRKILVAEPPVALEAQSSGLRGDILSLTTTAAFGLGLDSPVGVSRVAYRYDRTACLLLISCQPGACNSNTRRETDTWQPIASGVTNIDMEFYDGKHWQVQWNSKQAGRLPQAVKIAMTVTDGNGREHHYATTVPVVCWNDSQGPQTKASGRRS